MLVSQAQLAHTEGERDDIMDHARILAHDFRGAHTSRTCSIM